MSKDDEFQPAEWATSGPHRSNDEHRPVTVPDCTLEYPCIDSLSKMAAAPKYSFGSRSNAVEEKDESIPGPGSYFDSYRDNLRTKAAPKFSFGVATRHQHQKPRVPGPGEYAPRSFLDTGPGKGLSCTPRRSEIQSQYHRTPGPGAHNLNNTFAGHGPRHTMTPRRNAAMVAEERQRPGPGPGQYERATEILSQSKPPQWGFGSSPRIAKLSDGSTPGPGAYRHEANLNGKGPKYSMRARTANAKVGILLETQPEDE